MKITFCAHITPFLKGIEEEKAIGKLMPMNKSSMIKSLQDKGNVVAMVGDGVNDSVSMIQAHIG